ncbi:PEP-CTERM sorting domain-containing protein [Pseudomonas sp. ANT_H12B]|nr:PEP-CTERM sorting domain-containing protein [Pseudomonas sp. ANT_H12B]
MRSRWRIWVVALALLPMAMARALACCCRSPAAWLTVRLPWYCIPEPSMLALLMTGGWAKVDTLQNMAIISSERFILTVSRYDF